MRGFVLSVIFIALIGATAYYLFAGPKNMQTENKPAARENQQSSSAPPTPAATDGHSKATEDKSASISEKSAPVGSLRQSGSEASGQSAPVREATPESELKVDVIKGGTGLGAKAGDSLTVHYTGTFTDGRKFDSSRDRGTPFTFMLGAGQVIQGWDVGLDGMKIGEVRKLTVPPQYGYGAVGTPGGPIPPNATLLFEVELLGMTSS